MMSYQWMKDGQDIDGAITPELILHHVSSADSGSYVLWGFNHAPEHPEEHPEAEFYALSEEIIIMVEPDAGSVLLLR